MSMANLTYLIAFGSAFLAIIYGLILIWKILKENAGSAKMQEIAAAIQQGAQAYLSRQYKTIAVIALALAIILFFVFVSSRIKEVIEKRRKR